ncbi:hypothetical protein, partial [Providencia rustigianii]|uniref:hypothetical protein n=1 Tax=Providencia rustigianii TaxID=158850 RepID=UPI002242EBF5
SNTATCYRSIDNLKLNLTSLLKSRINKCRLFEILRETVNDDIFYPPPKPTTTRNPLARYAYG